MTEARDAKQTTKTLEDLKCLLILIASKSGATQSEIAKALGIGDRHLRRLMSRKEKSDEEEDATESQADQQSQIS